jgi:hypothetical protein
MSLWTHNRGGVGAASIGWPVKGLEGGAKGSRGRYHLEVAGIMGWGCMGDVLLGRGGEPEWSARVRLGTADWDTCCGEGVGGEVCGGQRWYQCRVWAAGREGQQPCGHGTARCFEKGERCVWSRVEVARQGQAQGAAGLIGAVDCGGGFVSSVCRPAGVCYEQQAEPAEDELPSLWGFR